jgi:hypothetical protein
MPGMGRVFESGQKEAKTGLSHAHRFRNKHRSEFSSKQERGE